MNAESFDVHLKCCICWM